MDKRNKGKRSTSATAREIAAAVRELKLADQAINKVRRHISPLAPEREITAAVIDLGAVTQVIYKAVRHIGKAVQIRRSEIRCAKLKKRNG
jgi:hypothetical protein